MNILVDLKARDSELDVGQVMLWLCLVALTWVQGSTFTLHDPAGWHLSHPYSRLVTAWLPTPRDPPHFLE